MKLSIGIKALNEARNIAAAIESALAAAAPLGGEVILADSGSTDATIDIARRYPVRIVQFANLGDRCCGAGAQLAFQSATGDYFYLLDGDMTLDPGFIPAGIAYLEAHPTVAGVGGWVEEANVEGEDFQIRAQVRQRDHSWREGPVDRLDCGGLYRTAAVRQVGWFGDRNLHAFEEFDIAARLAAAGWTLARLDRPAVLHFGHVAGGYRMLWRRLKSGYSGAPGEVLRGAVGQPHLGLVLRRLSHVRNGVIVIGWWLALLFLLFGGHPWSALALLVAPWLFLSARRGGPRLGLYSMAAWNMNAVGLVLGLFRPRVPPSRPLGAVDLSAPQPD